MWETSGWRPMIDVEVNVWESQSWNGKVISWAFIRWSLTKDEKIIIDNMTKSMVKPRNILLMLKEHNVNSYTIKQIYDARSAYRSSIRGSDTEMQQLMKLLERDQYIYSYRLKDEDVVCDIFWCHHDAVKLCNACNLVFFL